MSLIQLQHNQTVEKDRIKEGAKGGGDEEGRGRGAVKKTDGGAGGQQDRQPERAGRISCNARLSQPLQLYEN